MHLLSQILLMDCLIKRFVLLLTALCISCSHYRQFFSGELYGRLPNEILNLLDAKTAFFLLHLLQSWAEILDHLKREHLL